MFMKSLNTDLVSTYFDPKIKSNIRVLEANDLNHVDGGVGAPGAVVGAVFGGVAYGINAAFNGGTWGGFGTAVLGGAIVGATGGAVSAVGVVWGFNATVASSTASAIVEHRMQMQ